MLTIKKHKVQQKTIKYRKYKDIHIHEFCVEIEKEFENLEKKESVDYLVHSYNKILKTKVPHYSNNVRKAKIEKKNENMSAYGEKVLD